MFIAPEIQSVYFCIKKPSLGCPLGYQILKLNHICFRDTYAHHTCILKELSNTNRSRCRKCAARYNCKRTIKPIKHWQMHRIFFSFTFIVFSSLILFTGMFVAALFFLSGLFTETNKLNVIAVIFYVIVSYIAIAVGQTAKLVVFLEYSFCCVSKLDAVLPISHD